MRDIKIKYVYSNGANVFTKCFTLDQIEAGDHFDEICDCPLLCDYKIIDRLQCTGLKDKNGVEIYEGDIVEIEFEDGETSPMEVVYRAPRFFLCHEGFWSLDSKDVIFNVIGNIHGNPDLLEQQK